MEFTVPQFIEQETKIVGPLSFKQFAYLLAAAGISGFLYFVIPNRALSIFLSLIVFGLGFALALVKIQGTPLPAVFKNFLIFLGRPKVYFWKKKPIMTDFTKEKAVVKKEEEKEPKFKIIKKSSSLKDTLNKVAIK